MHAFLEKMLRQNTKAGATLVLVETPTPNQQCNPGLNLPSYFQKERSAKDGVA